MTVIGVLGNSASGKTENLIRRIFAAYGMRSIILESGKAGMPEFEYFRKSEQCCLIVSLKAGEKLPFYLDILILEDCSRITYELVKCISHETRLIYNGDSSKSPIFIHPNAISYGMGYNSEATASSIDTEFDGTSFVFCLQKEIASLGGNTIYVGEFRVSIANEHGGINSIIAAVTCGLLADVLLFEKVKI